MKTQMSLSEMASELERRQNTKVDLIAPSKALDFSLAAGDLPAVGVRGRNGSMALPASPVTEHAHGQIATHYGVPRAYYDRMRRETPQLWDLTMTTWATRDDSKRMIRCLDGNVRGFLSDRYRRIDDFDVAQTIVETLMNEDRLGGIRFDSVALTETRLYLKAFSPRLKAEVKKGDVVEAGLMARNSEVGAGALEVVPYLNRLACLNGMKITEYGKRRAHVGRRIEVDEDAGAIFYTDEAMQADDKALLLKIRDLARGMFDEAMFNAFVGKLREAAESPEIQNPEEAVEVLARKTGINEGERVSIFRHLITGGDLSAWGLANAVTRAAQDQEDYEASHRMEEMGGEIINLDRSGWREIAEAA